MKLKFLHLLDLLHSVALLRQEPRPQCHSPHFP